MAFEFKEISAEKLDACMKLLDDMYDDLDLDLPVEITFDRSDMFMDDSRGIYYFRLFFGGGGVSPVRKYILEQEGPYIFYPDAEVFITPYHWPALVGVVTPDYATLFTYFTFSVSDPATKYVNKEFVVASLSIQYANVSPFIKIVDKTDVPPTVDNVIGEVLRAHEEQRVFENGWTANTTVDYNFDVDMLKGLRKNDYLEN